jgi:hypothetical protein
MRHFALALAAIAFGAGIWSEARSARALAAAYDNLATFRFDPSRSIEPPLVERIGARGGSDETRRPPVLAQYWLGRYASLADRQKSEGRSDASEAEDADVMLVAANATFRAANLDGPLNVSHLPRIDTVLAAYAAVLKAEPDLADAAYNYEFVARLRDVAMRTPAPAPPKTDRGTARQGERPDEPPALRAAPRMTLGDLPEGPTIHGRPGGPPPATRGEEFQVITPMEYGEREAQPEASPGGKLPRKG